MRKLTAIFLLLIGINCIAQKSSSNYAIIEFVGDKSDNTKTYLGKIKKGNPNRLHDYLQQSRSSEENEKNYSPKEYKSNKERERFRHLSDIYEIDEKKLKRKKEKYYQKYLEKKKRVYIDEVKKRDRKEKDTDKFSLKKFIKREKIPKTKLSKQYKIKGKRIRKGKKLKFPEGNVSLIIKYKVRDGKMLRTYVTSVNTKVVSGFKYYLNYYGNDSKRVYYITRVP